MKPVSAAGSLVLAVLLSSPVLAGPVATPQAKPAAQPAMREGSAFDQAIAKWPPRPRLAAQQMLAKYGVPLEISSETVVWHNVAQYKRIMVTKAEIPHDFPKPHMDYLEHTVMFNVPTNKVSALVAFDASITVNKTAGEMSARCDLEGHNILTLNLARDVVEGKKSVAEARKSFGANVVDDVLGKHPAYVEKLQFEPDAKAAFVDVPVIPGSPKRADAAPAGTDAEVLAFVIAINENEILAAAEASKEKMSAGPMEFAKMMHTEHGKNAVETMKLAETIKVVPTDTAAVDALRVKGADELATLVRLDGKEFERAYMTAMVKGHQDVLAMFDSQLMKAAKNEALKKHLTATRHHVAMHLEKAQQLVKDVGGAVTGAP